MILVLQNYETLLKGQLHDAEGDSAARTVKRPGIQKAAQVGKENVCMATSYSEMSVFLSRHSQVSGSEHLPPNLQREHMEQVSEVLRKFSPFCQVVVSLRIEPMLLL